MVSKEGLEYMAPDYADIDFFKLEQEEIDAFAADDSADFETFFDEM
jgi:hypothetical protein